MISFRHSVVLLAATFVLDSRSHAEPAPAIKRGEAMLIVVQGTVETLKAGSENWIPGKGNQVLAPGDRLRTGSRSRAELRLSTLTVMAVAESSNFTLSAADQGESRPLFEKGSFSVFSRDKPMNYRTRLASGATRGTEFEISVQDDHESLTVFEGAVDIETGQGRETAFSNEAVEVREGQKPRKARAVEAVNVLQWVLYYPAILDVDELGLTSAEKTELRESLDAYRKGDFLEALKLNSTSPQSDATRVYWAALALAVGSVADAEKTLSVIPSNSPASELAIAIERLIRAIKLTDTGDPSAPITTATGWLAESYHLQAHANLEKALAAARNATEKDPTFGLGWQRLAELEFSFGRSKNALENLQKSFQISSRNPQAYSLQGFLLAAEGKISQARESFERALLLDGALGDAWLGRGLCRIRQGDSEGGREDLQMAAALEPQRSIFRSYLGKAFVNAGSFPKATHELKLASGLDPKDPTPWLYSAILNRRENNINEAVRDLEKSQELNNNRGVFRSEMLLDQDRAVRSANLAAIYQDAGMYDVALREASRALNSDYANYSAHLFLANSYGALSDPHQATLRYETPAVSEYLLANLLAPAGAGVLSQTVSQMEYGRLFEKDRLGLFSATEYRSTGNWVEYASQYGQSDKFSYAVDVTHRSDNGQRPNADFETTALDLKLKGQITRQDTALFELIYAETESGDQTPNYFNSGTQLRLKENQKPIALVGYHHEWAPGSHTLLLAGRLDDTALLINPQQQVSLFASDAGGNINLTAPPPGSTTIPPAIASFNNEGQLEIFTTELQQIWEGHSHTVVAGGRFQTGHFDNSSSLSASTASELGTEAGPFTLPPFGIHVPITSPALAQDLTSDFERVSLYAYDTWQILEPLRITAGLSYDHLTYPANDRSPPFSSAEESTGKVSPKAGIVWDITKRTTFRGSFSRSLGGVSFDQSFRLEPTQVGGFNQAYRSLMPEAIVGPQSSPVFETYALGLDHKFKSGTYVGIEAELLRSQVNRDIGIFDRSGLGGATLPSSLRQNLNFEERSGLLTINQLLGDIVSAGIRYRVSEADLSWRIPEVPRSVNNAAAGSDFSSTLHQFNPYILLNHSSGFFLEGDSIWTAQANREAAAGLAGADFWQHNIYAGYRFWRHRAEVSVGLLNLTDEDYNLFPLNLYGELPRQRTFIARLQLSF